jgi:hypothetical protein
MQKRKPWLGWARTTFSLCTVTASNGVDPQPMYVRPLETSDRSRVVCGVRAGTQAGQAC